MIGAVIGDIVGSRFEHAPIKNKQFKLFTKESAFTDDTVMTLGTLEAIVKNKPYDICYRQWGKDYPNRGYGGSFREWLGNPKMKAYNSFGNGSAMRVSPIGFLYNTEDIVLHEAKKSAECTHNHPEGIKGAQAVALAIFMARTKKSKEEIQKRIEDLFGYNFDVPTEKFKRTYQFDVSCQGSVPQAIQCFLEANSYEETIRRAVALGGDSDTLAAIAGSIADAYYGEISEYMMRMSFRILPDRIWHLLMYYGTKYHVMSIINYRASTNRKML